MEIVTKTTIAFRFPRERDLHISFVDGNDLREWERFEFGETVFYEKTEHYTVEAVQPEPKKRRKQ